MTLKNMKPPTEQIGIHRVKLFIDEFSSKNDLYTSLTHDGNLDIISPIQWKIIHEHDKHKSYPKNFSGGIASLPLTQDFQKVY